MPGRRRRGPDLDELLARWEASFKKGLLTFWILLLLHQREAYAYEISSAVTDLSHGTISADENSIYRALNRFESIGIVASDARPSSLGPPRRYYRLTQDGEELLRRFIARNILVFQLPEVAQQLETILSRADSAR